MADLEPIEVVEAGPHGETVLDLGRYRHGGKVYRVSFTVRLGHPEMRYRVSRAIRARTRQTAAWGGALRVQAAEEVQP